MAKVSNFLAVFLCNFSEYTVDILGKKDDNISVFFSLEVLLCKS